MTREEEIREKAKEIVNDLADCAKGEVNKLYVSTATYAAAMKMAQWKDEQLDSAIDKALERNDEFLKAGKITQYGYDIAFATIQNIREYLKQ